MTLHTVATSWINFKIPISSRQKYDGKCISGFMFDIDNDMIIYWLQYMCRSGEYKRELAD